ncbi:MAG: AI-2E family transporter [bacterium JZ-2024 1]
MWLKDPELRREVLFSASLFGIFVVLAFFAYHIFSLAFIPVFWGILLALITYPLYKVVWKRTGWKQIWVALLFTGGMGLVIVLPLGVLLLILGLQMGKIYQQMMKFAQPEYIESLQENLRNFPLWTQIQSLIQSVPINMYLPEILKGVGNYLLRGFVTNVVRIPVYVFYFFFTLVVYYFSIKDGAYFTRQVREFIPLPEDAKDRILQRFIGVTRGVFLGVIGTAFFQSFMALLGYVLFGVPFAVLFGFFTLIAALLGLAPVVYLPAVVYLGIISGAGKAVFLLVWCVVLVSTLDNYLRPALIGKETKLHPLFVFIFILGGLIRFGFMGIFLGPLILSLFITLAEILREKYFPPL